MNPRLPFSILIFLSAYSPLSIIFLIQDFDYQCLVFQHPRASIGIFAVAFFSIIMLLVAIKSLRHSGTLVITVVSSSNRSEGLINYSIPYMISFFVMDLGKIKLILSFAFFMLIMFIITLKTHHLFINPVLAMMGYNIHHICYKHNGFEYEDSFLIHGDRPKPGECYRATEISEQLYLVTDRNPEI